MKSWLLAPFFLVQWFADQPANPDCVRLPPDEQAACEERLTPRPPPPPPIVPPKNGAEPQSGSKYNDVHTSWGFEFTSPYTFSNKDEGTPGY
jgi:hypothetical protein